MVIGQKAKDKITGFSGVITGKVEYISGCAQFLLQPKCKKDGIKPAAEWIDEMRLSVVDKKIIVLKTENPGSDMMAPIK